jgi:hypothetical protein
MLLLLLPTHTPQVVAILAAGKELPFSAASQAGPA